MTQQLMEQIIIQLQHLLPWLPTITDCFQRRHKVVITEESKSHKHVQGHEDMQNNGPGLALLHSKNILWELFYGSWGAVWQHR